MAIGSKQIERKKSTWLDSIGSSPNSTHANNNNNNNRKTVQQIVFCVLCFFFSSGVKYVLTAPTNLINWICGFKFFPSSSLCCVTTKLKPISLSVSVREVKRIIFQLFLVLLFSTVILVVMITTIIHFNICYLYPHLTFKIASKISKIRRLFFHSKITTNVIYLIYTSDNVMFIFEIIISVKRTTKTTGRW